MSPFVLRLASLLQVVACGVFLSAADARALSFQADLTGTNARVQAGDTYADLLAAHLAGTPLASVTMTALEDVSARVEAGVNGDYSILLTAVLEIAVAGQYAFQVGADWGRGGAAVVIDNDSGAVLDELVRTDDIWWANDWNHADVFTTQLELEAGTSYTLAWLGFEGCCGGVTSIRFSVDGAPFQGLNESNIGPFVVPEPGSGLLLALGLTGIANRRRGERGEHAPAGAAAGAGKPPAPARS